MPVGAGRNSFDYRGTGFGWAIRKPQRGGRSAGETACNGRRINATAEERNDLSGAFLITFQMPCDPFGEYRHLLCRL